MHVATARASSKFRCPFVEALVIGSYCTGVQLLRPSF